MEQRNESIQVKEYEDLRRLQQENAKLTSLHSSLKEEYDILRESIAAEKGKIKEERMLFQKEKVEQEVLMADRREALSAKERDLEFERTNLFNKKKQYEELIDRNRRYKDSFDLEIEQRRNELNAREDSILSQEHQLRLKMNEVSKKEGEISRLRKELDHDRNEFKLTAETFERRSINIIYIKNYWLLLYINSDWESKMD